jgi:hypothetical protein
MITFSTFLVSNVPNEWVRYGKHLHLYVRRTRSPALWRNRYGDIQIANMTSNQPGSGELTKFFDEYEPLLCIYLENVMNKRLVKFYERRGYQRIGGVDGAPCFIKCSTQANLIYSQS